MTAIGYLEKDLLDITADDFLKVVEAHAKEGVDFIDHSCRYQPPCSRGFPSGRTAHEYCFPRRLSAVCLDDDDGNENPFFERYDDVLEILRAHDVTISIGDALRPGCIDDSSDAGQISELIEIGNLTKPGLGCGCTSTGGRPGPHGYERNCRQYADGKTPLPWCPFLCTGSHCH